jgi:hypothetical protein
MMATAPEPTTAACAQRRGVIAGSAAVLREVMATPRVRRSLEIVLHDLDAENAPQLVEALLEDPALLLEALTAAPALAQGGVSALRALLRPLTAVPPALLRSTLRRLAARFDPEELGRLLGESLLLLHRATSQGDHSRSVDDFARRLLRGAAAALDEAALDEAAVAGGVIDALSEAAAPLARRLGEASCREGSAAARGVAAIAAGIDRVVAQNSALVRGVIRPLATSWRQALERVEREEAVNG